MKGSTIARKARQQGWTVSTRDGGRTIWIRREHREHPVLTNVSQDHIGCGTAVHIHIYCDDSGDVLRVTQSTTTVVHGHHADAAAFALDAIETEVTV